LSSFNVDLNVADVQIAYDVPEEIEGQETEHVKFVKLLQVIGLQVPIGDPRQGMGALIPLGTVASILGREHLEKLIEQATEALEFFEPAHPKLPANFAIAGNMAEAAQFDRQLKAATSGKA
jgi:hypothetical protein